MSSLNQTYPKIAEIENQLKALYERHKTEYREEIEAQGLEWEDEKSNDPWKGPFNYNCVEFRDEFGSLVEENSAKGKQARILVWREADSSMPATKQALSTKDKDHPNWRYYCPLHPVSRKPCPHPKSGWKFAYADDADSPERRSFISLDRDGRIVWGSDELKVPQLKRFLHEVETNVGKSVFTDYSDGEKQTSAMFGKSGVFLAPKHADFVSRFIQHAARQDSTIVDCFGGSGSTAHAVIRLNRDDKGTRKFVLAEVGEYFNTVLKPRVLKALYSRDWRSGKPISREGISSFVKTLCLESYEDTLNNLDLRRSDDQQTLLEHAESQGADKFKEQYTLRYMLDVESRESASLLNIDWFTDPTNYRLKVKIPGSDESREAVIDLQETFNYLIGLKIQHISAPHILTAGFERDSEGRLRLKGRLKEITGTAASPRESSSSWWFRTVTGTTLDKRKILVIWRKRPGGETPEGLEKDNLVLDEWFVKMGYSSKDSEFDLIYVNGTNNLENLKTSDDLWKVRLIEEDFKRLMFEEAEA